MGFHATINGRPAPRVKATARVTGTSQQEKFNRLAGPVTVTRIPVVMDSPTVQEKRNGHTAYGVTSIGTRNGTREWRVVKSPTGTFIRAEYRVRGGMITVKRVKAQGFDGWMGFLTRNGETQPVPVAAVTRETVIEPHMIQQECRRIALRNSAQIGHGEL